MNETRLLAPSIQTLQSCLNIYACIELSIVVKLLTFGLSAAQCSTPLRDPPWKNSVNQVTLVLCPALQSMESIVNLSI